MRPTRSEPYPLAWQSGLGGALLGSVLAVLWLQPDLTYLVSLPGDAQELWVEFLQRHWPLAVPPRRSILLALSAFWGSGLCFAMTGMLLALHFPAAVRLPFVLGGGSASTVAIYANIVVASDHGITVPVPSARTDQVAVETGVHRRVGIILLRGPDIQSGRQLGGATVFDVAPTLLHLSGAPIPEDLPGRVLLEALRPEGRIPMQVDRTEPLGPREPPPEESIESGQEQRLLDQLRELGYILE